MHTLRVVPGHVAWLPWSAEAFARALSERKPILLSIVTAWSGSCREMERTSYADTAVAFSINEGFVPIRVDADRRPDIAERYNLGGWPTTAFLTPDGDVLGGGTFVDRDRMPHVLESVRGAFERVGLTPHAAAAEAAGLRTAPDDVRRPGALAPAGIDAICTQVFDLFDEEFAGFGRDPKFPHTAPLHLALALHRLHPDKRLAAIVTRSLDAMTALYDEQDGGFYRYATSRDWTRPHTEKLLDVNASLVRVFLDAAQTLEIARYAETAANALLFVQNSLADPDGGWYGSQTADGDVPDRAFYADGNAVMASAALSAAAAFDDGDLRDLALKSLERVLLACYKPGQGVAHYVDGGPQVRGLLGDQIAMAQAQLEAYEATGNIVYEMMAEELAHYAVRTMWDLDGGGFLDRANESTAIGLLRAPLKPFVANCEAARMLKRLAAASGDNEFTRFAAETLAAMAPVAASQGPLAAHYVLAAL